MIRRGKQRQHATTRQLVWAFAITLVVYNTVQIVLSTLHTLEGISNTAQLTYVDVDENDQANTRHPYYTICPILNKMADLESPNQTLVSVMVENSIFHPVVYFFDIFNTVK